METEQTTQPESKHYIEFQPGTVITVPPDGTLRFTSDAPISMEGRKVTTEPTKN